MLNIISNEKDKRESNDSAKFSSATYGSLASAKFGGATCVNLAVRCTIFGCANFGNAGTEIRQCHVR